MSEHVNMPVRRLKALNYEEEFQSKGAGNESRVKLFSSEEMMERMLMKKRAQKQGLEDDSEEETRKRREYQQQLFMLRDGSAEDEESDNQRDDMQEWLQSLHIKTKSIIDKCKPSAATQVATAAVRLKGKKVRSQTDVRSPNQGTSPEKNSPEAVGNGDKSKSRTVTATHVATVAVRLKGKKLKSPTDDARAAEKEQNEDTTPDKSGSETEEAPVVKEAECKPSDDSKPERKPMHHVKVSSSKQMGHHQKRDGKGRHHTQSFKHRTHRQKAQATGHE